MCDVWLKRDSIIKREKKKSLTISWSKLRQFDECPASWFLINYADILNVEVVQINQTKAIPGIIIQKVFEVFINDRVYLREEMKTYDDLLKWFEVNTKALFYLLAKPIKDQYLSKFKNPRNYFKRKAGKTDLEKITVEYGLDTHMKSLKIAFVDLDQLKEDHGSEEGFLNHINSLYKPILDLFVENEVVLNYMLSEVYVQTQLNDVVLNGYIDFVYNKNQTKGCLVNFAQICNGFVILDGKYNVSRYVKKEQLMYYAMLIYLKCKKTPSYVGFIDWNKAKFSMRQLDYHYLNKLRGKVANIRENYLRIKELLNNCPDDKILLSDLGLEYTPSAGCLFCPLTLICKPGLQRKADLERYASAIKNKKETKKDLEEKGLDLSQPTQEIKF